jgi:hypothetical protein
VKWKLFILVLGILVLTFLLFPMEIYRLFNPISQEDVVQKVFKGQENFDVVTSSQQVTAQLLHKIDERSGVNLSDYVKDNPILVSPAEFQKIKNLMRSPSSYRWDVGSSCIPDYGVLLIFRSGQRTVRVAICFKCELLAVFEGEDDNGKVVSEDRIFSPMRPQLVTIAKSLFPNDKKIQGLKEKRR